MAMPAATPALMLRVEPNWAMDTVSGGTGPGAVGDARSLLTEYQQALPRQGRRFQAYGAGHVVDGDDGQPGLGGERQQFGGGVVMAQSLIAVCHHRPAPVPAAPPDDVDGVHRERIGRTDDRADVGVVAEVLDRDVQRVPAPVDVGDDRFPRPIAVRVNDIAGVTVAQQHGVIAWVVGRRPWPRADTGVLSPFGRPAEPDRRRRHRADAHSSVVHKPACVPISDSVG